MAEEIEILYHGSNTVVEKPMIQISHASDCVLHGESIKNP